MKTLVTGATGFVGRNLIKHLDSVMVVSRNAESASKALPSLAPSCLIPCDLPSATFQLDQHDKPNGVIHLLGEPVDGRWTDDKKKRIRDSRILGTRNLVQSLVDSDSIPDVFVGASAIGYYGETGDETATETSPPATDFLAQVCSDWENETKTLSELGSRVVLLRIGLVFGSGGRAIEKILTPFRWGLGGKLGSGRQWMSWIHLDDLVNMILEVANNDQYQGPVNAVAPNPIRNVDFTRCLGKTLKRPTWFTVPRFVLRGMVGEFSRYVLMSQRVKPSVALTNQFSFRYPNVELALNQIAGNGE